MSKPKIIIAALILGLGLAAAYFIVSNYNSPKQIEQNIAENPNNNPVGIELITASSSVKNLTDLLTQKIEEKITAQNSNGTQSVNGQTLISAPDPKQLTEDLISEAQKNFDPNQLIGRVDDFRIKISEDTSKESISKYFNSFSQIMISANANAPISMNQPEKMTVSDFSKIEKIYETAANNFYELPVPKSALDIHKKEIELLLTKKNIYGVMANSDSDPMTAFLAVDELLKLDQEFDKLKTDVGNFLKTI